MSPRKFRSLELGLAGLVLALVVLLGLPVMSGTSSAALHVTHPQTNEVP
ncbi:MAG: hypothetical protein ACO3XO_10380 [Bdellovibrionota bacterium]|jgi:hypothetical protein